jgi:hypothetical protein
MMSAWFIHVWIGCLFVIVIIRVMFCKILLIRHHFDDSSAVSCFKALIAVVRKYSVIAFLISPCIEGSTRSCDVVGAVLVSPGLCQIIAA